MCIEVWYWYFKLFVTEIKLPHNKWFAAIVRSALSKRPFIKYSNHYVKYETEFA